MPSNRALVWMAPATPVFAGEPAPTGMAHSFSWRGSCGSGHAREAGDAVDGTGYAGVRGRARSHGYSTFLQLARSLWERVYPRSRRRGGWHRLRRCSRVNPLPQVWCIPSAGEVPVGAGLPAKQATPWMAGCAGVRGRARSHSLPDRSQTLNRPTNVVISPTNPDNALLASLVCCAPAAENVDSSRMFSRLRSTSRATWA
ncbi:exported protein of unknown function, partial [Pseudomonas inefficax]